MLHRCFSKVFPESFKSVSRIFLDYFKEVLGCFKGISRVFQGHFLLRFCCCMAIITASQAGRASFKLNHSMLQTSSESLSLVENKWLV